MASLSFPKVHKRHEMGNKISEQAQTEIQRIINDLTIGGSPDKKKDIERIRAVCAEGRMNKIKTANADLFVESSVGKIYLFDLKTVKPNKGDSKSFKRTLLEWVAIFLLNDPDADVCSYIAIPYNPYEPKPYERWTLKGMLDLDNELMVAEEFWDFLAGKGAYSELLDCFERAGIELRPEIDAYFSRFRR